jgi:energy-coupling factor transport system permease protein
VSTPAAPGGLAARAHPFTPLVTCFALIALAFLLPAPSGPVALAMALILFAPLSGDARALLHTAWLAGPFWLFLFLLHGVMGEGATTPFAGIEFSRAGSTFALTTSARITAVIVASLLLLRGFRPGRFVDAAMAAGWSWPGAYLGVATLHAIPRFQARATRVAEAMRARGLRVRGSIFRRAAAVVPLALPLMLGALHDVDERAFALATRQASGTGVRRTPLDQPVDTVADRAVRLVMGLVVFGALVWRFVR